ncbi:glycosyltransferase [Clostridium sp. Marseille-P299]|uniref:glycosyltransferase n=1 Tax=Clostridium sp. Marseille-P299 TaxID=1805477 RepID=UPI000833B81B|nr:glycosyltransferase [Clostridium sp. Marseille-P299]
MKVSVLMATYNGEAYLLEQLDSIRNQNFEIGEVLIQDDCSTDFTVELIKKYIVENKLSTTWHFYQNDMNLGYANNFMELIKKASGEFIFFCDQDDIWELNKIETMIHIMESNDDIQLLGSEYTPFYSGEGVLKISKHLLKQQKDDGSLEKISLDHKSIFIGCEGCTMCIRKSLLDSIMSYWFKGWAHDEFVWKLALCQNGCYVFHQSMMNRRIHGNNVSKQKMRDLNKRLKFLGSLEKSHESMLVYAKDRKMKDIYIELIEKNIRSVRLRIELLENRKISNTLRLILFYWNNYHSRKSIPVELMMAFRI